MNIFEFYILLFIFILNNQILELKLQYTKIILPNEKCQ